MTGSDITKKIYYRIVFRLASALSVGGGENQYSDGDMIRNSLGEPFVPGSSLAGIYRSLLDAGEAENYFGTAGKSGQDAASKVLVYDARLYGSLRGLPCRSVLKACVGLDEWKTGRPGDRFDFEAVEPGTEFVTYLEQNFGQGDRDICEELAAAWLERRIRMGRKTMRGLGSIDRVTVRRRSFDFTQEDGLDAWLDFDMYREEDWERAEPVRERVPKEGRKESIVLEMTLRQKSGISIRRYTTRVRTDGVQPDAEQLTCVLSEDGREMPYIPGTSWAGVFRHHMEQLAPCCTKRYFGSCERRSQVRFAESFIQGASPKILVRNAVDRFTGGTVDTALFTEKMWYGGTTRLCLEIPEGTTPEFRQALAASLVDLHMGLLCVGGLTAVGRGLFEGEELKIDGKPVPISGEMYGEILKKLEGR